MRRSGGTLEAAQEVAVFRVGATDVDKQVAVEVNVVAVAVEVSDGVADELPVLFVGEGLEGSNGPIELPSGLASRDLLRGGPFVSVGRLDAIRFGEVRQRGVGADTLQYGGVPFFGGGIGDINHRPAWFGRREGGGLLGYVHGPGVLDVAPQPASRVLDGLLVGECLEVVEAVAGPVLDHELLSGLWPHALGDEGLGREALAVGELRVRP